MAASSPLNPKFIPPTELDWFNFETRMRTVVANMLEPTIRKQAETDLILTQLTTGQKTHSQRLELLEAVITDKKDRTEFTEGLFADLSHLQSNLDLLTSRLNASTESLIVRIESAVFHQAESDHSSATLKQMLESISQHTEKTASDLEKHKTLVLQELTTRENASIARMKTLESRLGKTEETDQIHMEKIDFFENAIPALETQIEAIRKNQMGLEQLILEVQGEKADLVDLEAAKESFTATFGNVKNDFFAVRQTQADLESYMDLYVPTAIQCMVSDSVFAFADKRMLQRYIEHETQCLKSMRNRFLSSTGARGLDVLRAEIAQQVNSIDSRRTEFLQNLLPGASKNSSESPLSASKKVIRNASTVESEDRLIGKRQESAIWEEHVDCLQTQQDLYTKISNLEAGIKDAKTVENRIEVLSKNLMEIEAYNHVLHDEFDSFSMKSQRRKTVLKSEFDSLHRRVGKLEEFGRATEIGIRGISELVSDVVEFSLVVHALLDQDEVDRRSLQLTGYKDQVQDTPRTRPKLGSSVSLDQSCLSCSGSGVGFTTAFKMACLTYNPSPLKYRGNVFTRAQMIETAGGDLKAAWSRAVAQMPFYTQKPVPEHHQPTPRRKLKRLESIEKSDFPQPKNLIIRNTPRHRLQSADA